MSNKDNDTNKCKHKWVFQETQKKVAIESDYYGYKDALFRRIDVYYCEKCCEIKKVEQIEKIYNRAYIDMKKDAPIWY